MVHNLRSRNICHTSPKTPQELSHTTAQKDVEEGAGTATTTPLVPINFFHSTIHPDTHSHHFNLDEWSASQSIVDEQRPQLSFSSEEESLSPPSQSGIGQHESDIPSSEIFQNEDHFSNIPNPFLQNPDCSFDGGDTSISEILQNEDYSGYISIPSGEQWNDVSNPFLHNQDYSLIGGTEIFQTEAHSVSENMSDYIAGTSSHISSSENFQIDDHSVSQNMSGDYAGTSSDISIYRQNLHAAIDDVVFNKTYNVPHGVSLVRIKQSLHDDYGYNPSKFKKIVSQYVVQSISEGKLQQMSGRGANGSFRMNKIWHNRFKRAHKLQSVTKLRNVSKIVNLKRFKQNDSNIMNQILNQTKKAQRMSKGSRD